MIGITKIKLNQTDRDVLNNNIYIAKNDFNKAENGLKKDRKIGGLVVWENFLELKGFAPENVMLSPPLNKFLYTSLLAALWNNNLLRSLRIINVISPRLS